MSHLILGKLSILSSRLQTDNNSLLTTFATSQEPTFQFFTLLCGMRNYSILHSLNSEDRFKQRFMDIIISSALNTTIATGAFWEIGVLYLVYYLDATQPEPRQEIRLTIPQFNRLRDACNCPLDEPKIIFNRVMERVAICAFDSLAPAPEKFEKERRIEMMVQDSIVKFPGDQLVC
jgi:hypothetical protein